MERASSRPGTRTSRRTGHGSPGAGLAQRDDERQAHRRDVVHPRLGVPAGARPARAAADARHQDRAALARRRVERPVVVPGDDRARGPVASSGERSIRSSSRTPWISTGAGLVGNGCVAAVFSPGTLDCGTARSSIGHSGVPVTRSKANTCPCLVTCATAFTRRPSTVTSMRLGAAGKS